MKISLDFDGTCVTHKYPYIGQEAPNCINTLMKIKANGHKLFLYTMRDGLQLEQAVKWLNDRGIILDGVNIDPDQILWTNSRKCNSDINIDDRDLFTPMVMNTDGGKCVDWFKVEQVLKHLKVIK